MVFSSLLFTFFFLPVVLILYFLARERYRNYILLAASIVFYAYGEPKFVFVMLGSIFCNYLMALLVEKFMGGGGTGAKICLIIAVAINISILFIFKYLDFAITLTDTIFGTAIQPVGILLPIGISFFTFQALSYVIDVYRGKVKAQKNPLLVALYIAFFPQLIAGPIVRYTTIEDQINHRVCTPELFGEGARRFMLGFGKKVILANNLAMVAQSTFSTDLSSANPLYLWLGSICFSLQIYYDFSGYSDMAIGLAKLFGFQFEENFNYPYIARSVTDYWRRWHISLSQWFRDYVYIPLGGSRVSKIRWVFNMLVVWLLTGIWHGANVTFLVWGLGYFVLLVLEKMVVKPADRKSRLLHILWPILTLLCINFGFVIFNSPTLADGIRYLFAMVGGNGTPLSIDSQMIYSLRQYGFFIVIGILFATPVMKILGEKMRKTKLSAVMSIAEPVCYGLMFLWAVSFLILGAHNPFIYFNF